MAVSPVDTRYNTKMNKIFDEENKLAKWMEVEAALARAHAKLGTIPKKTADEITKKATLKHVKLERVKEIEAEIHHDLMAMVKALAEQCDGEAGGFVHLGATSYDIEDTAQALIFRDALDELEASVVAVQDVLLEKAILNKHTVCIGRTHGQHAVPLTYGLKFALWASELDRHLDRLHELRPRILVGKMSGAVGSMATFGDKAFKVRDLVMADLGLEAALATNQVVQRDRYAEAMFVVTLVACTLEKIAKEIRNLQRTEIMEVAEPFAGKQVGSSTMPHKRNPHKSERVCALARLVRAELSVALENISLEHERDLTNSANERVIFPEMFIFTDYILGQMKFILEGLEFFPENIQKNLEMTKGMVLAERLMVTLANKGMSRQDAHELLRKASRRAYKKGVHLKEEMKTDKAVLEFLKPEEVDELFVESTYIGKAPEIVDEVVKRVNKKRGKR